MFPEASRTQRALAFLADICIALCFLMLHRFWGTMLYFLYMLFRDQLPYLNGQSIGKRLMHIRVIREDEEQMPPDVLHHIIRNATLLIPFFNLLDVLLIYRSEQKRLGDVLAGTIVIRTTRH